MKTILIGLMTVLSCPLFAQTIVKIDGNRVNVTVSESQSLTEGEAVNFLDENLNVKAAGLVEKLSPQGRSAIIRVTSGKVSSSFTLEKAGGAQAAPVSKPQTQAQSASDLTTDERKILARGEIGTTAYVLGGILGTYPLGLGIGHAIQGRYSDKGWIFTAGELGAVAIAYASALDCVTSTTYWSSSSSSTSVDCSSRGGIVLGLTAFVALRIWEIIDLWAVPPDHNRRYRELVSRTGRTSLVPIILPRRDTMLLGLQYQF
jgi:hypothetical protein